ncbi:MAG: aromatic acid exporter family protein [Sporomusaceae bacterium]|nr:aromatic acid exporter family protein [Sporomusaceae bacterium]
MRIGARVIKTGIAVAITMFLCKLLGLEPAFFGAVSAVINIQPSIFLSLREARNQVLVHVLGVAAGFFFGLFLGVNPLSAGLIVILLITLFSKLKLNSGITMGIVAALFVLSSSTEEFMAHALARTGVIFVGLGSAMLVNVFLWPPRYTEQLKEKLRQSNEATVLYFCHAVQEYVGLEGKEYSGDTAQRARVEKLNKEARRLLELLSRERTVVAEAAEPTGWLTLAEKLIDYNESITHKGNRIIDLLPGRLERRINSGDPPISDEFRAILSLLASGCVTVVRLNGKLRSVIVDGGTAAAEEISEDYWETLTKAIEQWQPRLAGSYYLHALLEVAVTANEIKWASRQAKLLLSESLEAGN